MKSRPKKKAPINMEKLTSTLQKVGGGIVKVVSTHPAALGLTIMAGSTLTLMIARKKEAEGSVWGKFIAAEANGLYQGAQGITLALSAVPIVTSIAGAVKEIAGSRVPAGEEGPATK